MAGLSPSGAASEVGMSVTEAAIAIAILKFLREKLISVHSGDFPPALVAAGGRGLRTMRSCWGGWQSYSNNILCEYSHIPLKIRGTHHLSSAASQVSSCLW